MPVIDQWFTLATAGETIDGRVIEEQWLRDMAESYSTDYYTAVIDADHELDWYGAYGNVSELRIGEKVGRVSLEAKLNVNYRLMEMNRNGQRLWFSIEPREVEGKVYLFRLAITDNPASIGTDQMKFSAGPNGEKPSFSKPKPFDFSVEKPSEEDEASFFKRFKAWLKSDPEFTNKPGETPDDHDEGDDDMKPEQFEQLQKTLEEQGKAQVAAIEALGDKFAVKPADDDGDEGGQGDGGDNNTEETVTAEQYNTLKDEFDELKNQFDAMQKKPAGGTKFSHQGGADDQPEFI